MNINFWDQESDYSGEKTFCNLEILLEMYFKGLLSKIEKTLTLIQLRIFQKEIIFSDGSR